MFAWILFNRCEAFEGKSPKKEETPLQSTFIKERADQKVGQRENAGSEDGYHRSVSKV